MSQGAERGPNDAFNRALEKLDDATGLQRDANDLKARLSNFQKSVNDTFDPLKELTAEIEPEKDFMRKIISHFEMNDKMCNEELRKARTTYDETARQHKLSLDAQNEELSAKLNELAAVKQELSDAQSILKQNQDLISKMQHEMTAEVCLLEEQRHTYAKLLSLSEKRKSKFVEEQKFIQSESARLDKVISSERAKKEAMLRQKSAMSKKLAAIEDQKRAKFVRVDRLRSKLNASKAEYAREMKLNEEIQARQRNQDDELLQLEHKLSEGRAGYENAKKADDDITNRINSEYGSVVTLEEMLLRAEAQLRELDLECSGLSDQCVARNKRIVSNEIKITKLNESNATFLEEIRLEQRRNDRRSTKRRSQMSSDAGQPVAIKVEHPLDDEHIFLRPSLVGGNAKPKKGGNAKPKKVTFSQDRSEQQNSGTAEDKVVNHSASSSLSELWPSDSSEMPAEDDAQTQRHERSAKLFQKYFM